MKLQPVIHHIEYMPSGEQFAEQRNSWGTSYKFNGKELDAETGLYYYGARYYAAMENIWLSVDPLSDKYPSISAYMYCAGNPVILVDPDGREIWITGDAVSEAFNQLQNKTNLKLSINSEGKVEAKGIAWTKADRLIKKAAKDDKIRVNIVANNSDKFKTWNKQICTYKDGAGGAYGGAVIATDGTVDSYQYVNPSISGSWDNKVGDEVTGGYMLHEVAEGYYSGKIALKRGKCDWAGGTQYEKAHQKANRISGGGWKENKEYDNLPNLSTKRIEI